MPLPLARCQSSKCRLTIWTRLREKCERQHIWNSGIYRKSPYQWLLPLSATLQVFVTQPPYGKIEFLSLEHFEQACSDADFEFDANVGILTAEALQDLRQPALGKVFTDTNSQFAGMVCAR